jgi:hypothetical protein
MATGSAKAGVSVSAFPSALGLAWVWVWALESVRDWARGLGLEWAWVPQTPQASGTALAKELAPRLEKPWAPWSARG